MTTAHPDVELLELDLLLEGVRRRYGYDFRDYARASLLRRVRRQMAQEGVSSPTALLERVLHDPEAMQRLLLGLSVHVTAMFRDLAFYRALRAQVVPHLKTWPFVRVWHAGCSTGEEAWSLAIVLAEEGLADRCRIYATDMSEAALARAKEGMIPLESMREYAENYIAAGGARSFSEYYVAGGNQAAISPALRSGIVWAQHNLVTDSSFDEFHLLLCRNVMIYFNRALQDRVHQVLYDSLPSLGTLALGARESLKFTVKAGCYEPIDEEQRLYRKVR